MTHNERSGGIYYLTKNKNKGRKIVPTVVAYHSIDCDFSDGVHFYKQTVGRSLYRPNANSDCRVACVSHFLVLDYDLLYSNNRRFSVEMGDNALIPL